MKKRVNNRKVFLILHNIRSSANVGSLFRTSDAAGVNFIYLSGYTPNPIDKFGKANGIIKKTALGAEKTISWIKVNNLAKLISKLKQDGYQLIAIEQSSKSTDYKKIKIKNKVVFLLGNEVRGISKKILEKFDVVAEIPMKGKKESLNVSVAGGIAIFRILRI